MNISKDTSRKMSSMSVLEDILCWFWNRHKFRRRRKSWIYNVSYATNV